ncbi:putative protein kinase RLK-Pelle-RLCK-V family [Helianthus annuus]|nr:putative protein kinase RLK-Pelle-RLCK-V family [Helianthus annuus]
MGLFILVFWMIIPWLLSRICLIKEDNLRKSKVEVEAVGLFRLISVRLLLTRVRHKNLAQRLNYLHEGIEHIVVHRAIKSSNILLNRQWHPKVSDFGLAKLLGSETSYVTTYVAPEYGSTGMLNERSDVCLAHKPFSILLVQPLLSKIEWRDTL